MLREFLQEAGYTVFPTGEGDVRIFLAGLIQAVLSVVGIIFFVVILYGGYLYLTAAGNDEQISKAKRMVSAAVVGFLITLAALIITRAVGFLVGSATAGSDVQVERESVL